jgi:hypothetical protein
VERSTLLEVVGELPGEVPLQAGTPGTAGVDVLEHAASSAVVVAARSASAVFFIIGPLCGVEAAAQPCTLLRIGSGRGARLELHPGRQVRAPTRTDATPRL